MARMYPGAGRPLYLATYPSGQPSTITWPATATIPNGSFSEAEPIADAMLVQITVTYASAPGSVTTVQYSPNPLLTNTTTLTTMPATSDLVNALTITAAYNGFIRISNTSGVSITGVTLQKQDSTFG